MHRSRFAFLAAADIGIIATFLPWEKIMILGVAENLSGTDITESVLGTKGVGWITLACFVVAAIISFTGKRMMPLSLTAKWVMGLIGLLTSVTGIHTFMDVKQKAVLNPLDSGGLTFESVAGIGLYLIIAAGLALLLLSFVIKAAEKPNAV